MPRYFMAIVERENAYQEPDALGFEAIMQMHQDFAAAVAAAGATIVSSEALQPSPTASYFRNTRTDRVSAVDNPLPEVKEVFGGYYLVDAADDATAADLAKQCPAPYGFIELRPIWDFS